MKVYICTNTESFTSHTLVVVAENREEATLAIEREAERSVPPRHWEPKLTEIPTEFVQVYRIV